MDNSNVGLRNQRSVRRALRVAGAGLLVGGLVLAIWGAIDFVGAFGAEDPFVAPDEDDGVSEVGALLRFAGGGFALVIGIGLLNAGTLGAQARYAAGEVVPVLRDSASHLSDGQGIMGAGRTVDDAEHPDDLRQAGPYCRACGVRNDVEARFCDSCGSALA